MNQSTKMALITGASSGIGTELAHIHAERGGDLIIVARRAEELNALKKTLEDKHNVSVTCVTCDLSVPNSAQSLYEQVTAHTSAQGVQIDYLFNNAGFGLVGAFQELPLAEQQSMMHLNMVSLAELMHLFLPEMVARNEGRVLNTSSTASLVPGPNQATYYATKAFVTSLSNAVAQELSNTKVTVTNLMPGPTKSEFGAISGMDKTALFNNAASTRTVAEAGYNAMLAGKLDVISGLSLAYRLQLKFLAFLPKKLILKQIHNAQQQK